MAQEIILSTDLNNFEFSMTLHVIVKLVKKITDIQNMALQFSQAVQAIVKIKTRLT